MITILLNTIFESSPYIILGFLLAGILRFWVPQNILQHHLGGRTTGTLFKSIGIGCLLPLCSCGTIPLGIGLFKSGASIGNMLAFMTSTPVLSPILIAMSIKMLGFKLTITLVAATVIGAFIVGVIGNRLFKTQSDRNKTCGEMKEFTPITNIPENNDKSKLVKTVQWSLFNLGADISVDIAIGLSIASLLLAYLPLQWISSWLGQQDLSTLMYVILLGLPVYACSIPSIAVVQGLLLLGVTPGAAVAYMIAGPATNLGELNAIRNTMGIKPTAFYTLALVIMALLAGVVTDRLVFPNYQYHAYRMQGELIVNQCCVPIIFGEGIDSTISTRENPTWNKPFGYLLMAIIVVGIIKKTRFFFINPCLSCTWKAYGVDGYCGSKCHVRRKYEYTKKLKNLFFS
jgi:uncharacterized membrane protein YraQ (UPF0718 family)